MLRSMRRYLTEMDNVDSSLPGTTQSPVRHTFLTFFIPVTFLTFFKQTPEKRNFIGGGNYHDSITVCSQISYQQ